METETRILEVDPDILDPSNVSDRVARVYMVTEVGRFVDTQRELKDPVRIKEDADSGGDGTFRIVDFRLDVQQLWPERGAGEVRTLEFSLTRPQAASVRANQKPALHPASPVGRLTQDLARLGLPMPADPDLQGHVVVVSEWTQKKFNSENTERRYSVVASVGDRKDYDLDKAIEIAQSLNEGSKRVV